MVSDLQQPTTYIIQSIDKMNLAVTGDYVLRFEISVQLN
jgi:hypothetical protein